MPSKMTIFHFNCSLCGAHPREEELVHFLGHWKTASREQIDSLLNKSVATLQVLAAKTKSIDPETTRPLFKSEIALLKKLIKTPEKSGELIKAGDWRGNICLFDCPLCSTPSGVRPRDRYFTFWSDACRVQTANFLYELGLLLFAIASALPSWATNADLLLFSQALKVNRKSQGSLGFDECSFCRRFANGMSGEGTKANPYKCRWCYDNAGGKPCIVISLTNKGAVEDSMSLYSETQSPSDKAMMEHFIRQNLDCFVPQGLPEGPLPDTIVPAPQKDAEIVSETAKPKKKRANIRR